MSQDRDRSIVAALRRSEHFTPALIRKDGDLELWNTIVGDLWMPAMRLESVRKLTGEVEYDAYDLARAAARVKSGVVLDCGANIGLFACAALRAGAARVICFEPAPRPSIRVEVKTVDSYMAESRLDRVGFIKMDIEGAETEALGGATQTLRRFAPILAVATEHTTDVLRNTHDVLAAVPTDYRSRCLECHAQRSPAGGFVLTPFVVQFVAQQSKLPIP